MKLGLGTAQLGLNYGITNSSGKVSVSEAELILSNLAKNNIDLIDTAYLYGDSEKVLGNSKQHVTKAKIVTKTAKFSDCENVHAVENKLDKTFAESLSSLQQDSLYSLLVHDANDLLGSQGNVIWEKLEELQERGMVEKIGISVYAPEQLDSILDNYQIDIVQLPLNVFDQRFITTGLMKKLKSLNVEIHVRSIFLQGILLQKNLNSYPKFCNYKTIFFDYAKNILNVYSSLLHAALGFIHQTSEIDYAIIGVTSLAELRAIVRAWEEVMMRNISYNFSQFATEDVNLILPTQWK